MKVLECKRCHSLFKSSDNHLTIQFDRKCNNFCDDCSKTILMAALHGMDMIDDFMNEMKEKYKTAKA